MGVWVTYLPLSNAQLNIDQEEEESLLKNFSSNVEKPNIVGLYA